MQFRIVSLLILTCVTAVVFGLFSFAPLLVAAIVAVVSMAFTPTIWITGAVFAKTRARVFFIGGISSGFLFHLIAVYYLVMLVFNTDMDIADSEPLARLMLFAIWAAPGVAAFIGGGLSLLTYRLLRVSPTQVDQSSNDEQ
jgi:hypothetical protein